jgi:hypothetical protein
MQRLKVGWSPSARIAPNLVLALVWKDGAPSTA